MNDAWPDIAAQERYLADELVRGDAALAGAAPILRHLLSNDNPALFNQAVVAHVRGTVEHVTAQLLKPLEVGDQLSAAVMQALIDDAPFLSFVHSQALEAHLAIRLDRESGIDPVLPPLLQELVGSPEPGLAEAAMAVIAAQARFVQQQRRMELPLRDLPGELFHRALEILMSNDGDAEQAATTLRDGFDEGRGRLGLLSRLAASLQPDLVAALDVSRSGLALFATALSLSADQPRELTIASLASGHSTRLALALRAAGMEDAILAGQIHHFQRPGPGPALIDRLPQENAAALLARMPRAEAG